MKLCVIVTIHVSILWPNLINQLPLRHFSKHQMGMTKTVQFYNDT
jgi:hypothetical protein